MRRPLSFADMLCGGGGSSEGLRQALLELGLRPEDHDLAAINHWWVAIENHVANFPHAKHYKRNIFRLNPKKAVPSGKIDVLTASPVCIHFSTAKGGRPVSWDQRWGRMTAWQVYRWLKELDVRVLLVENVPEFRSWGPVCNRTTSCIEHDWKCPPKSEWPLTASGKRVKKVICGKRLKAYVDAAGLGCHFKRWVSRIKGLGYKLDYRILNAADFGDATTRKRFFLIARKDGQDIEWPAESHSETASPDLFGAGKLPWRAAAECIDWDLKGRSIFNREEPLSKKTLERILVGARKNGWPDVFLVALRNHMDGRPLTAPMPTVCAGGNHLGVAELVRDDKHALVFQVNQGGDRARNIRDANAQPLQTVVTGDSLGMAEALVMRSDCQGGHGHNTRTSRDPIYTPTTACGGGLALVLPQGSNSPARTAEGAPLPATVAVNRTGLIEPFVLNRHGTSGDRSHQVGEPLVMANRNENVPRPASSPMHPATTAPGGGLGVVEPLVLGQHGGATARCARKKPVPSVATDGAISLISPYYRNGKGRPVTEPLATATTRDRFGLVTPVTHGDGSDRTRSTKRPLPTVTGASRGELAFITPAFGERPTQEPRTHAIAKPMPTLCAQGRLYLVEQELRALGIDILFRMLEPKELASAMGFPADYKWIGNKTQNTRMIGNAVAVNVAKALFLTILRSLLPKKRARRKVPA